MAPITQTTEVGSAEIYFAKKLANNDKKVRDKAVKRLKSWLISKEKSKNGLVESELQKIWKGLFYCMWFSDKPLIQEELANTLSQIIHSFDHSSMTAVLFCKVFFVTMGREWLGIDRLRLDKFYMLIKKFICETLMYLSCSTWSEKHVMETSKYLQELLTDPLYPDGLKMYFSENIIAQLISTCKLASELPNDETFLMLLEPYFRAVAYCRSRSVITTIRDEILLELRSTDIYRQEAEEEEEKEILKIPYGSMADRLCELGADKNVQTYNRKIIFTYVNQYRELADQIQTKLTSVGNKSKRKRKSKHSNHIGQHEPEKVKQNKKEKSTVENDVLRSETFDREEHISTVPKKIETSKRENKRKTKLRERSETIEGITNKKLSVELEESNIQFHDIDNVKVTLNFSCHEEENAKVIEGKRKKTKRITNRVEASGFTNGKKDNKRNLCADDQPKPVASFMKTPPPNAFFRKALLKTEPAKKKSKLINKPTLSAPRSEPGKKKVRIDTSRNIAVDHRELKISPMSPFSPTRKPYRSALRTPLSSTRLKAEDHL